MTLGFSPAPETNRIFVWSALGSLVLHGMLLAVFALTHNPATVEKTPPRVQVQLVQNQKAHPVPSPPQLARVSPSLPPPTPTTSVSKSMPVPPAPQIVQRPRTPVAPPKPQELTKPTLKDTQTARTLQAREMMKMASPVQPSFSRLSPQMPVAQPLAPPPMAAMERTQAPSPALRPFSAKRPQALQSSPPESAGDQTTRPVILASSKPLYPRVAREAGWEGTVIVRTLIDQEGIPTQTEVRKSSGHPPLDQSAIEAIKTWTFRPARDGNIPIAKWVDIPVKFDLNR